MTTKRKSSLSIDLFNCDDCNFQHNGWVGILDRDETYDRAGGWFFNMPDSLHHGNGRVYGNVTAADIDAAVESLEEDEIAPPVGLDRDEAEALVRETLAKYVA